MTSIETALFNAKLEETAPKKLFGLYLLTVAILIQKIFLIQLIHYWITRKTATWKKYLIKIVLHALKLPKNLIDLLSKPNFQNPIFEKYIHIAMNIKIPIVIYACVKYQNVQIS